MANLQDKLSSSWDFQGSNTKEFTHCFHSYPAMMIPQIARRLISMYGILGGSLLDPYCGTGTSLVEASLYGMDSTGFDINPLARLISSAKTAPISLEAIDKSMAKLDGGMFSKTQTAELIPDVLNLDYWFSDDVVIQLAIIRNWILSLEDDAVRNFFWVAFSEVVRECSLTRNGEFKLFRMTPASIERHSPDAIALMRQKVLRNKCGLIDYITARTKAKVCVASSDTSKEEFDAEDKKFDLVVTSPPYGDSSTTVAYGQFSRLSADWIGFENSQSVDRNAMGGCRYSQPLPLSPVSKAVKQISKIDAKRGQQVEAFYHDLSTSISTVSNYMADRSVVCYVVGNRRVKNIVLPTNEFVAHEWQRHGFIHSETFIRNIPNKRMPSVNSPTNMRGSKAKTMTKEYIVVCQRR